MEDRSYRKRQNMLSDIQAMIVDYKKKSNYSNLVSHQEQEDSRERTQQMDSMRQIQPQMQRTEPALAHASKQTNNFD